MSRSITDKTGNTLYPVIIAQREQSQRTLIRARADRVVWMDRLADVQAAAPYAQTITEVAMPDD